jgi:hypothetical protein
LKGEITSGGVSPAEEVTSDAIKSLAEEYRILLAAGNAADIETRIKRGESQGLFAKAQIHDYFPA